MAGPQHLTHVMQVNYMTLAAAFGLHIMYVPHQLLFSKIILAQMPACALKACACKTITVSVLLDMKIACRYARDRECALLIMHVPSTSFWPLQPSSVTGKGHLALICPCDCHLQPTAPLDLGHTGMHVYVQNLDLPALGGCTGPAAD